MKVFLTLLVAVIAISQAVPFIDLVLEEWKTFKIAYNKKYDNDAEEKLRMKIFMENKHMIAKHNAKYELGFVPYKLEINQFGDMFHREFVSTMNRYGNLSGLSRSEPKRFGATFITPANVEIPDTIDWRTQGAVTGVKNQGHCGSCWAFSTTGALEGQHFRKTGVLVSLSEQNLIDCSLSFGNNGCKGGFISRAIDYIEDNNGIDTENSYPYEAKNDVCRFNSSNVGATCFGLVHISKGEEDSLKAAVATVGPVSVVIDASHRSFHFYKEGIYYEPNCSEVHLDHAVLAVGYGTDENGHDYWLVKNSWGQSWGEEGYIKMARNRGNNCGIASKASYPSV